MGLAHCLPLQEDMGQGLTSNDLPGLKLWSDHLKGASRPGQRIGWGHACSARPHLQLANSSRTLTWPHDPRTPRLQRSSRTTKLP